MRISELSDLDLARWKEYPDILTDSLWQLDRRDTWGPHAEGGDFHGNFVPQIAAQLLRRFTRPGDWVCDPFLGCGTSLIEAARWGRSGVGIELNGPVAHAARERILMAQFLAGLPSRQVVIEGDCADPALWGRIAADRDLPAEIDFLLLHPPYWDIVRFNAPEEARCLGNADTLLNYVNAFGIACVNLLPWLKPGHFGALVIGDCYKDGEWVTLGAECWRMLQSLGMQLKAQVVKDIGETRAKGKNNNLWRRRALAGGFYVFRHESVYIWRKPELTPGLRNHVAYRDPAEIRRRHEEDLAQAVANAAEGGVEDAL